VHQLVNKKNFDNIKMHGTTVKKKRCSLFGEKRQSHAVYHLKTIHEYLTKTKQKMHEYKKEKKKKRGRRGGRDDSDDSREVDYRRTMGFRCF
jgi:hypothetical protein